MLRDMSESSEPGTTTDERPTAVDVPFEEFFRDEYPRLAKALLLLTGDRAEAEDLAQEALARTFERWERVRNMDNPTGYVYRTAFNLNHKRLRHLKVRSKHPPEPHPVDATAAADTRADVLRALADLPQAQREAVVLVEWLGLDALAAGELLGIDASSVRGRIHRARQSLRERIGEIDV